MLAFGSTFTSSLNAFDYQSINGRIYVGDLGPPPNYISFSSPVHPAFDSPDWGGGSLISFIFENTGASKLQGSMSVAFKRSSGGGWSFNFGSASYSEFSWHQATGPNDSSYWALAEQHPSEGSLESGIYGPVKDWFVNMMNAYSAYQSANDTTADIFISFLDQYAGGEFTPPEPPTNPGGSSSNQGGGSGGAGGSGGTGGAGGNANNTQNNNTTNNNSGSGSTINNSSTASGGSGTTVTNNITNSTTYNNNATTTINNGAGDLSQLVGPLNTIAGNTEALISGLGAGANPPPITPHEAPIIPNATINTTLPGSSGPPGDTTVSMQGLWSASGFDGSAPTYTFSHSNSPFVTTVRNIFLLMLWVSFIFVMYRAFAGT